MRCTLVAVLLLGACGRLQFDAVRADADGDGTPGGDAMRCIGAGHDEDHDGIDDACDLCPQRADDGNDADADGVGNVCDYSTDVQRREVFDPFTGPQPQWQLIGGGAYVGDDLVFNNLGGGAGALWAGAVGVETFELNGTVVQSNPAQSQISLTVGDLAPGPAHYYCELYDDGTTMALAFTYTLDESVYNTINTDMIPGRFDAGDFSLIFDHAPPMGICYASWKGVGYMASGPIPGGIAPNQFAIATFQIDAELHSFVRLATP